MAKAWEVDEALRQGVQKFVKLGTLTAINGVPGAGQFRSSVVGRGLMTDLTSDLRALMAGDRIHTQYLIPLKKEQGPSGEPVFAVANDLHSTMRFVGQWSNYWNTDGYGVISAGTDDFVEITFYGTGLNLLSISTVVARDVRASVDGAAEGGNVVGTGAGVIAARGYSPNQVTPIVKGLSLGLHTVKLRNAVAQNFFVTGFEVVNESSSLKVNPGIGYVDNRKLRLATQQTVAYGSDFESGVLGTRGGRVVSYLKKDGTIKKAVTPVDGVAAYLTSASHANEEIARVYNWREFTAGRSDDFRAVTGTGLTAAFTLEDGTTSLLASSGFSSLGFGAAGQDAMSFSTNNHFWTFTFVGTGLDIIRRDFNTGAATTFTVYVDGVSVGTLDSAFNGNTVVEKIASGLPYGTHTVKVLVGTQNFNRGLINLVVYQPKKPTVPDLAIELADYNVMASFSSVGTAGVDTISTGVLRKFGARELSYVGTWAAAALISDIGGWEFQSTTSGSYMEYTFFGTGIEIRFANGSVGSNTATVSIDGNSNLSGYTTSSYGGGITSFVASTGVVTINATTVFGNGISISGIPLGLHTVRLALTGSGNFFDINAIDVITPVHSYKNAGPFVVQNSMPVGSQGLADLRESNVYPLFKKKRIGRAVGATSAPNTSSNAYAPLHEMCVPFYSNGGRAKIDFNCAIAGSGSSGVRIGIFIDGVLVHEHETSTGGQFGDISISIPVELEAGVSLISAYWKSPSSTSMTALTTMRTLTCTEEE